MAACWSAGADSRQVSLYDRATAARTIAAVIVSLNLWLLAYSFL